ncbi:hypothetical protein [Parasutterella muris]|uniref:hypothetical protein n=1 Tax=Parasutterella muris TaxID=2565572 RepID=UPI00203F9922|nr:hypothetical protein [Parasutterella muris]
MIYQKTLLVAPKRFLNTYESLSLNKSSLIVRPTVLSICAADQRYFWGDRDSEVLQKKLPMALIHEGIGEVIYDPNGIYKEGTTVVLLPNKGVNTNQQIYSEGAFFRSSNQDGFTQEMLELKPSELIPLESVYTKYFVFTEIISVCLHAISRISDAVLKKAKKIAIWGDGVVGYLISWCLRQLYPSTHITVVGRHEEKLILFTHVDEVKILSTLGVVPHGYEVVFEAVGGKGAEEAIQQIITACSPLASICLLGVSENRTLIDTRKVLEKGLTILGSSRSTRKDFEEATILLGLTKDYSFLDKIISEEITVRNSRDLFEAFEKDRINPMKTLIFWDV